MKGGYYIGGTLSGRLRLPIFVTQDRSAAEWYASERGEGGRVYPVSIRANRSFRVDSADDAGKLSALLKSAGIRHTFRQQPEGWTWEVPEVRRHSSYDGTNPLDVAYIPRVRELLVRSGYDSLAGMDQLESTEVPVVVLIGSTSQLAFDSPMSSKGNPVTIDYDRLAEDLRDEVDSFAPARDTGRRDYDMDDVIDRFVSYASGRPGIELDILAREFGRQDPASAGQIRKLRGALREIIARERKNPVKTKNPVKPRRGESRRRLAVCFNKSRRNPLVPTGLDA